MNSTIWRLRWRRAACRAAIFSAARQRSASPRLSPTAAGRRGARRRARSRAASLKAGLQGGESTNSLDPALNLSQVPFSFGKLWGELLVELSPEGKLENRIAEEIGSSDDAKTWTLKIRDGIEFHNGKTVTAEDVAATSSATPTRSRSPARSAY